MLKNNIYNIDKELDYPTVKNILLKSLENVEKEEAFKNISNIMNDVISDSKGNDDPNNVKLFAPPAFKAKNQKYHRISNMASFDIKEIILHVKYVILASKKPVTIKITDF